VGQAGEDQTAEQWRYIALVALDIVDALGVDLQQVDQELRRRFGAPALRFCGA